jgi:hypothetical protein
LESLCTTIASNQQTHSDLLAAAQGQNHNISALRNHIDQKIVESAATRISDLSANTAPAATAAPRSTAEVAPGPTAMQTETDTAKIWFGSYQCRGQDDSQVATFLQRTLRQPLISFHCCTTDSAILEIPASAVPSILQLDGQKSSRFPDGVKIARACTQNVSQHEVPRSSPGQVISFTVPCANFHPPPLVNAGNQRHERQARTKKQQQPQAT